MIMIEAFDLARTFATKHGPVEAVRGLDFTVRGGEIVGFLGPNGAGKTTTLRMLTTLLSPTSGQATVTGCDLLKDPNGVRRQIGYVAQGGGVNPAYTVFDELYLQGRLYRLSATETQERIHALVADLELTGLEERLIGSLSGGQRRRLDIALGLIHRPPLLFLDEPSAGLDPNSRNHLWSHISRLRDEHGMTVFLTTHYLDEADALCDRILIIDKGRIVAEDSPWELKRRISGDIVTIEVAEEDVAAAEKVLEAQESVTAVTVNGTMLRVKTESGNRMLMALLRALDSQRLEPAFIEVSQPSLDDVFLSITGGSPVMDAPVPSRR